MSEWEPATDAEVAMRDALRTDDQESYFRILSTVDLLLPVSADALAGLEPLGWGTWSTGGRTHVLAFTSSSALQACLADYTGSARRVPYAELANTWPNLEWWLAVNPGLPIEGYLPAWFVAQLSRGDLRLPTRGPGRESGAKIQDLHAAALAANAVHGDGPGGPMAPNQPDQPAQLPAAYPGQPQQPQPAPQPYATPQPYSPPQPGPALPPSPYSRSDAPAVPAAYSQPSIPPAGYGQPPAAYAAPFGQQPGSATGSTSPPISAPPAASRPASAPPASQSPASQSPASQPPAEPRLGPGGLPVRSPSGVSPSGLPTRPAPAPAPPSGGPGAERWPSFEPERDPRGPLQDVGAPLPVRTPMAQTPPAPDNFVPHNPQETPFDPSWSAGDPRRTPELPRRAPDLPRRGAEPVRPAPEGQPAQPQRSWDAPQQPPREASRPSWDAPQPPPDPAPRPSWETPAPPRETPGQTWDGPGQTWDAPAPPREAPGRQAEQGRAPEASRFGELPRRGGPAPADTPMGMTPGREAAPPVQQSQGFGSPLPRRQATPPSEQTAMTSFPAFQTKSSRPEPMPNPPAQPLLNRAAPTQGVMPPVIPGAAGTDRPARFQSGRPTSAPPASPAMPAASPAQLPVRQAPPPPPSEPFVPANDVEQDLKDAADSGNTDVFLSTLLLATVLVPVAHHSRPGSVPGEPGFAFRTEEMDGEQFLVVFTSRDRLVEHFAEPTRTASVKFYELIRNWPDPAWSFAVNPGSPIGAKYPGPQVIALASWAAEAGLGAEPVEERSAEPVPAPEPASDDGQYATIMQKTLPPDQVDYYLERGYDRVAGFVHRASEVEHLRTPAELFAALGLTYDSSPHQPDAKEAFVLRWPAYRPSLYRIPYGGQNEQALKAMDGWVIERAPFRGNGFAPGESRDVVAEFKVDSVRLPHGAQLWRLDVDGNERMVAIFDNDGPLWRRVGEQ